MVNLVVPIKKIHPEAIIPRYMSDLAAGLDLYAVLDAPCSLAPGERVLISTGIALAVPAGYEAQVRPRSGLAWRDGITLLNSPGTIDADYRGEIKVIMINHGDAKVTLSCGERIAQLIITPVMHVCLQPVEILDATERGAGGFGHTGSGVVSCA